MICQEISRLKHIVICHVTFNLLTRKPGKHVYENLKLSMFAHQGEMKNLLEFFLKTFNTAVCFRIHTFSVTKMPLQICLDLKFRIHADNLLWNARKMNPTSNTPNLLPCCKRGLNNYTPPPQLELYSILLLATFCRISNFDDLYVELLYT